MTRWVKVAPSNESTPRIAKPAITRNSHAPQTLQSHNRARRASDRDRNNDLAYPPFLHIFIFKEFFMTSNTPPRGLSIWAISLIAAAFGLLSVKEGGTVLFGSAEARAAVGNYVPFVVWFNFLGGFAYVVAGIGLFMQRRWAMWLSIAIAASTAFASAALGIVIFSGGPFEQRTAYAMGLRTVVWMAIAGIAWHRLARPTRRIA
jgi:hypothetical protein